MQGPRFHTQEQGRRGRKKKGNVIKEREDGRESGGVEGEKEEQEKKVGKTEGSEEEAGKGEEIVQTS